MKLACPGQFHLYIYIYFHRKKVILYVFCRNSAGIA